MRGLRKWDVALALSCCAPIALGLFQEPASAASPAVTINTQSISARLIDNGKGAFTATVFVPIKNDGERVEATHYALDVIPSREYKEGNAPELTLRPKQPPLAARSITAIETKLVVHDRDSTTLTIALSVTQPADIAPSSVTVSLRRSLVSVNFIAILVASLALGSVLWLLFRIFAAKPKGAHTGDAIFTSATFSFNGSWATGIAAVLTVVSTVFSASTVLTDLVPGIDTDFFLAVTIVFGVVLALAPIVYSLFQRVQNGMLVGRKIGFEAASIMTLVAVGGQLSTIGAIVWLSGLPELVRYSVEVLLGLVAIVIVIYSECSRRQLWMLPRPPTAGRGVNLAALV